MAPALPRRRPPRYPRERLEDTHGRAQAGLGGFGVGVQRLGQVEQAPARPLAELVVGADQVERFLLGEHLATGFAFDVDGDIPATPDPTEAELALLRGKVCDEMAETYPEFCRRVWGRSRAA